MGNTYHSLSYHVVFSTKNRAPSISNEWITRLHSFMAGILKKSGAHPKIIGGIPDHAHLLFNLPASARLSDIVREVKKASTQWVRETTGVSEFQWQEGYAAFSVGASAQNSVIRYIANQAEHHRKQSFIEELETLLKLAHIEIRKDEWA